DELFAIERTINGKTPDQRLAVRREQSKPLVASLESWLREQCALVSSKGEIAKAINYSLNRWAAFTRFLDDGRICLSNNAAERAVRGVAVGRKNWTFAGSDAGGHRAAALFAGSMRRSSTGIGKPRNRADADIENFRNLAGLHRRSPRVRLGTAHIGYKTIGCGHCEHRHYAARTVHFGYELGPPG